MPNYHAVGIDLGTTYSAVAELDSAGRSAIVRNADGEILTPSVVLFDKHEIIVGRQAKKMAVLRPEAAAECVKRDMGSQVFSKAINGKRMPPEVIQSYILKKLRDDAVAALGPDIKCVITVPAYFDEPRRKATTVAAEMAGLDVLDIVNEPTAAALAFGETLGYLNHGTAVKPIKVLVYDLGGGTFDVTVIDLKPGDVKTLATDGDVRLGGRDWDTRMVDFAAKQFQDKVGSDPRKQLASLTALLREVEDAKHTLSAREQATLHVKHSIHSADLTITRQQFEELTEDLLERTACTTREVLSAAHLTWKQIDRVLLVGGSTRMPMVERMLKDISGITPDHSVHPDEAVARGAAIFAGYLLSSADASLPPADFKVVDVNSHTLGIEGIDTSTGRKENMHVIRRNTPLPAIKVKRCMTKRHDQRSVVVQVLEGESKFPDQCSPIGRAVLRAPPGLPQATPINVTYEYQRNGCLKVLARLTSNPPREIVIELEREQGMSQESIGNWKRIVAGDQPGFDAFESMLEEVVSMSEAQRDAEMLAAQKLSAAPRRNVGDLLPQPAIPLAQSLETPLPAALAPPGGAYGVAAQFPAQIPLGQAILSQHAGSPQREETVEDPPSSGTRVLVMACGLVVASTIGLLAGYYILALVTHWNPLHMGLPGLPPAQRAPLDPASATDTEP